MRKFADKYKICITQEDYIALMKTLEKLGFRWVDRRSPTDLTVMSEIGCFPVKIYFGGWGLSSKHMTYSYDVDI